MSGLDPTPFTAWGVLGLLGVVLVVFLGVFYKLFIRQSNYMESRDKSFMEFVDRHRTETTASMEKIAGGVASSYDKLINVLSRQARGFDEIMMTSRVMDRIERMKERGHALTNEEIEVIVRSVMHERTSVRSTDPAP